MPDQTQEERAKSWDEVCGRSPESISELVSMLDSVMAQDSDVVLKFTPGSDSDCELLRDLLKVQSSNASLRARVEELTQQAAKQVLARIDDGARNAELQERVEELEIALHECCRMFAWCDEKYGNLLDPKKEEE